MMLSSQLLYYICVIACHILYMTEWSVLSLPKYMKRPLSSLRPGHFPIILKLCAEMSRQASQLELLRTRNYHHFWKYYIVTVLIIKMEYGQGGCGGE